MEKRSASVLSKLESRSWEIGAPDGRRTRDLGHNPSLQLMEHVRGRPTQGAHHRHARPCRRPSTRSPVLYSFRFPPLSLTRLDFAVLRLKSENMSNVPTSPSNEISSTSLKRTKIVLLGDQSVGKTSLITRCVEHRCFHIQASAHALGRMKRAGSCTTRSITLTKLPSASTSSARPSTSTTGQYVSSYGTPRARCALFFSMPLKGLY